MMLKKLQMRRRELKVMRAATKADTLVLEMRRSTSSGDDSGAKDVTWSYECNKSLVTLRERPVAQFSC